MTSAVLTVTANDIVKGALRLIGETDANQSPEASETQDGLEALNFMMKAFQSQGLHLWTKVEGILFTDVGKQNYKLGPNGDEACNEDDFINTELSVVGAALASTITVDSVTGMLVNDKIGIKLDSGVRHWTTIKSINTSTKVITLTVVLPTAAAIDNSVFTFTSLVPRPLRILQLRRDTIGNTSDELESDQWSRKEYFAQPDKDSQGDLVNWYYTPELTNGRIYVWQTSNDADKIARFTYIRPIDINTTTADNPDFPSEWFRMLKYNLAVDIAPEYRIPQDRLSTIKILADEMLENALE